MEDIMFEINNTLVMINSQIYIVDKKVSELEGIAMKKKGQKVTYKIKSLS